MLLTEPYMAGGRWRDPFWPTDHGPARRCELCGAEFEPHARGQRFCSRECRESACRGCAFAKGGDSPACAVYGRALPKGGLLKPCAARIDAPGGGVGR